MYLNRNCVALLSVFCTLFFFTSFAQTTIWTDNFNSYADIVVTGTGKGIAPAGWNSGNNVRINSSQIETGDANSNGYWRTQPINVTGFTAMELSFNTSTNSIEASDQFSFRYRLDGGSWVTVVGPVAYPCELFLFDSGSHYL